MKLKKQKKLNLHKETITNLNRFQLGEIKAGGCAPCWENVWTLYYCDVIYTAYRPPLPDKDSSACTMVPYDCH